MDHLPTQEHNNYTQYIKYPSCECQEADCEKQPVPNVAHVLLMGMGQNNEFNINNVNQPHFLTELSDGDKQRFLQSAQRCPFFPGTPAQYGSDTLSSHFVITSSSPSAMTVIMWGCVRTHL